LSGIKVSGLQWGGKRTALGKGAEPITPKKIIGVGMVRGKGDDDARVQEVAH